MIEYYTVAISIFVDGDEEKKPGDAEIIAARSEMHELPVLVFEGMDCMWTTI